MRLIDADELKEAMLEESDWWENADVWIAHNVIDKARTIEPVKHGKWIDDGDCFICSNCRKAFGFLSAKCVTNFCPDCGADMRSGEK